MPAASFPCRPCPDLGLGFLLASTSIVALLVPMPASGQTVTCTFVLDVDGNAEPTSDFEAILEGPPAIAMGGGATITVLDATLANTADETGSAILADLGSETLQGLADFLIDQGIDAMVVIDEFGDEELIVPEGEELAASLVLLSVLDTAVG
ncbi:MAG: hypothetical protein AAFV86_23135 [Pseudomonadota bacterium]